MAIANRKRVEAILVEALASGATVAQAGVQGGVSERTVYRHLQKPEFLTRIQKHQEDTLQRATALATAAAVESARSLLALHSDTNPPSVRRAAARDTLELGFRLRDDVEIEDRLRALENEFPDGEAGVHQDNPPPAPPPPTSKRPRRGDAILHVALAAGATVTQAAGRANLHERTVRRRLQDPLFRKSILQIRADIVRRAAAMLNAATISAIKTLIELKDSKMPASIRRLASRDLIEMAERLRHAASFEKRLSAMENWW